MIPCQNMGTFTNRTKNKIQAMYMKFHRSTVGKTTSNRTSNEMFREVPIQNRLIKIKKEMIIMV
jgi:hypothetical protein